MQKERTQFLNKTGLKKGKYIVYWMQQSQREEYNHALEYAVIQANALKKPCIVFFGLTDNFPGANARHYAFMLEGLRCTQKALVRRGIQLVVQRISPEKGICRIGKDACLVITDRGYLGIQKKWRAYAASHLECRLVQVESDVIVPVETASPKEEFSAATFRPKFNRLVEDFAYPIKRTKLQYTSLNMRFKCFSLESLDGALKKLKVDRSVAPVSWTNGGTDIAKKHLNAFIRHRLNHYEGRNDPSTDFQSNLSPYLHFGQISPLYIYLKIKKLPTRAAAVFLEELAVRRELSMNFVHYNNNYFCYNSLPDWAKKSLKQHIRDERPYLYKPEQLENAKTHDPYWNAAQQELVMRGKMHGYMRMYWGKKILEWTDEPAEAFRRAVFLNDRYSLDGRDPNGYTGIAWCFGKHDRPWQERRIFGKVRYMNAAGLERKFNMEAYLKKVNSL